MGLERLSDLQLKINTESQLARIEHDGNVHVDSIASSIDERLAEGVYTEHQKHQEDQKHIIPFERRRSFIAHRRNAGNVSRLRPH